MDSSCSQRDEWIMPVQILSSANGFEKDCIESDSARRLTITSQVIDAHPRRQHPVANDWRLTDEPTKPVDVRSCNLRWNSTYRRTQCQRFSGSSIPKGRSDNGAPSVPTDRGDPNASYSSQPWSVDHFNSGWHRAFLS
jgi:hypothetical protein